MTTRAIAACLLAASLAAGLTACATPLPEPREPVVMPDPVATRPPAAPLLPEAPALPQVVLIPGPSPESFVGQPVADIEAVIGLPDLVRREGGAEFRRYDLTEDCRAYVVALPEGGTVLSVDTGARVQGMRAPAFEDCTARQGFAGS